MSLFKITYYRKNNSENIKSAIVKEIQIGDIKRLLRHIKVVSISPAPKGIERTYLLE